MITTARGDELHRLVNMLPANTLDDAERALRAVAETDPLIRTLLNAPLEDEPISPAEEAAVAEACADVAAGRVYRLDDIRRDLLAE